MKRLYALCLLTLLAVAADILYFRASPVSAQGQSAIGRVTIHAATFFQRGDGNILPQTVNVTDARMLGFQCIPASVDARPICFIATGN